MHESLIDFANSFLNSTEDAEEVVSDFFIVIWKRRESLGEIKYPKLYFFAGVKNTALNRIKLNKRQHITTGTDWQSSLRSIFFNPEELMLSHESVKNIMKVINELPPRCKMVFKLVKEEGFKYAEVSQLLDISIKTVEAQMAIAFKRLKDSSEFKNDFPELHSIISQKK